MQTSGKKTVLLVEDDDTIRSFLKLFLMGEGYEVFSSRDGLEALSMAAHFRPQVIVTDLLMPRVDGLALIKEIKTHSEKSLREIPIIAVSGASEVLQVRAISAGAFMVLKKPVHRRTLLDAVAQVLKK